MAQIYKCLMVFQREKRTMLFARQSLADRASDTSGGTAASIAALRNEQVVTSRLNQQVEIPLTKLQACRGTCTG
jgi:hypothetical protein